MLGSELVEIPNIGPKIAEKLARLGITTPKDLKKKNPVKMYERLNRMDGVRHDPCLLDVFAAAVDFVKTGKSMPWWHYSRIRKKATAKNKNQ